MKFPSDTQIFCGKNIAFRIMDREEDRFHRYKSILGHGGRVF